MDNNTELLISVFDRVTNIYGNPYLCHNEEEAKRCFIDLAAAPNSVISKHPGDFELCRIGYFDRLTGQIFSKFEHDTDVIMTGLEAVAKGDENE